MLVIAVVLVLVAIGCAVLVAEASRSVVPLVGPGAQILAHSAAPAEAAARTVPTQRTASDSARAAATHGFIADLPAEKTDAVRINL
jgi:hypothetical protein